MHEHPRRKSIGRRAEAARRAWMPCTRDGAEPLSLRSNEKSERLRSLKTLREDRSRTAETCLGSVHESRAALGRSRLHFTEFAT